MTAAAMTVDVALRDGATVCIRPMRPGGERGLCDLLDGLSIESRLLRLFSAGADLHRAASYMAALEPEQGRGLMAVAGDPGADRRPRRVRPRDTRAR
jgi:acetate---CoA ligase (ADP-forming)